jgi:8-oxo-dGTP pyrophosphatase MutT (NUDIX family)
MEDMKLKLKRYLASRDRLQLIDETLTYAAVLIPLFLKDGEYHLLFTRRTDTLRDHRGQISFPGGRCEQCDETPLETALRESWEEIGLEPTAVEVLGALDDRPTMHTNYLISPWIGVIPWPVELKPDPVEVAEVITVPVSVLLAKDALKKEDDPVNNGISEGFFYYHNGYIIWGATARILTQFLEVWRNSL